MQSVGAYEAKTHLPALLERVVQGESITITRHGVPVARLVPVLGAGTCDIAQLISQVKQSRDGRRLGPGESIRQMIEEGRR